jgi:hypothetical protein
MGRRQTKSTAVTPEPARSGDIIQDGDYAGMTYEEVTDIVISSVHDAYANLSLEGVCMVHDYTLNEILEVCEHVRGHSYAYEVAQRFEATLKPYLRRGKLEDMVFQELLALKLRREEE